jgi:hypothetical protein
MECGLDQVGKDLYRFCGRDGTDMVSQEALMRQRKHPHRHYACSTSFCTGHSLVVNADDITLYDHADLLSPLQVGRFGAPA